jgi:pSer/pThr/pTyr-binding forkhead associated (FHA) protein
MPKLIISERGRHEEWTHDCKEQDLTLGRHDDNIIALPGRGISRYHARITKDGDDFFLHDLESGNGTFLNGMRITPGERYLLKNKDSIAIDTFDLLFYATDELLEKSYQEEITENDILEVKLLKKVLKAVDKETVPSFEVLNGSAEGEKFYLTDEIHELIIGRDPDIDFSINEHVISRRHAKVVKRWGGISIRDLESKNGTFVNNRKVIEEYLHDGDRIALGTIVLMFRNPQEINLAQMVEKVPPKHKPAAVKPEEIPGVEAREERPEEEAAPEQPAPEEEFERLEEERARAREPYPTYPSKPKPRFSPVEIGMIGLGMLVFIFALITLVNLLFA